MDDRRFDDLTRVLGTRQSRRAALRAVVGGVMAVIAGGGGAPHVDAALTTCFAHGHACGKDRQCCSGRCTPKNGCKCPASTTPCGNRSCCTAGQVCSGGVCATPCAGNCTGKTCGDDGCGGSCGTCIAPQTCGGGGVAGQCGCTPISSCPTGVCGSMPDGCGGIVTCAPCQPGACETSCGDGVCGPPCTPNCSGITCGADGCGGTCGSCAPPESCGGGGVGGLCGCTPLTVCPSGVCGPISDGCGGTVDCGGCEAAYCLTCGSNNTCVSTCGACQTCVLVNGSPSCSLSCAGGCVCPDTTYCEQTTLRCIGTSGGCFIAGTQVAMADGTSRPIEWIAEGDDVLRRDGGANRVTGVARPLVGHRPLYALNGSRFFVTAEHPFMTEDGWKSIDPAATAKEMPDLDVRRLAVGDRLVKLAAVRSLALAGDTGTTSLSEVEVQSLALRTVTDRRVDPETPLFNLLVDGDHAYFADDLLVHNKFF